MTQRRKERKKRRRKEKINAVGRKKEREVTVAETKPAGRDSTK